MTNTAQEFKVGDKFVVTKESFRQQGYTHVYVVTDVTVHGIHFTNHNGHGALATKHEIEKYVEIEKYIETEKHIHHDLIVAWAKDPKGVIIQYFFKQEGEWRDTVCNNPLWETGTKYRIKPKTKEVQRWKWVFKVQDGYEVTNGYYTDEEANKNFDKAPLKIEDSVVTAIEGV